MVRVYGCEISEAHALRLVGELSKNGSPEAQAAAATISRGVREHGTAGKLTPEMRDAILDVIDFPRSRLAALHGALLNDQRARA
jgi:hypothetical protein